MADDHRGDTRLKVAVVHNLLRGGARRRLSAQVDCLDADVREFTLSTSTPLSDNAVVVPLVQKAPTSWRLLRPVPRHLDVERVARAWHKCFEQVEAWEPDVVWLNPCHLLQAPAMPATVGAPTYYYCDEPRRADYDPAARAATNPATRPLYAVKRRRERHLDRATVSRVDSIGTNSAWTAQQIWTAYGRKAEAVPCGVPDGFTPAPTALSPTHFLSVGTLIPNKGHDLALQAIADSASPLGLVVVAPRPDKGETARLRDLAAGLSVDLEIRIGISDDELLDLYRQAFATLYLARNEPLGLVSLEAQACGSPVIVAAEGGLPETIVDGRSGWAVPRTPAAVAERINELSLPGRRDAMIPAAALHGSTMTWRRSALSILDALGSVARRADIVEAA